MRIVIPAYHEERRLPPYLGRLAAAVEQSPLRGEIQIVDDGTPGPAFEELEEQVELLRRRHDCIRPILRVETNRGKGHAVRLGWEQSEGNTFLAFVDADGSVAADYVVEWLETISRSHLTNTCWIGDRHGPGVKRHVQRAITGWIFAHWVDAMLKLPIRDYQCGFKVVEREAYVAVKDRLKVDGFAFDSELLAHLHANGTKLIEFPVPWVEKAGSHVPLIRASLSMVRDVCRVRRDVRGIRQRPL